MRRSKSQHGKSWLQNLNRTCVEAKICRRMNLTSITVRLIVGRKCCKSYPKSAVSLFLKYTSYCWLLMFSSSTQSRSLDLYLCPPVESSPNRRILWKPEGTDCMPYIRYFTPPTDNNFSPSPPGRGCKYPSTLDRNQSLSSTGK